MAFVSGPRQVGKTTTCRALGTTYLDWDNSDDRRVLLAGPAALAEHAGLDRLSEQPAVIVLDDIHKYRRWKGLLKGFYDTYRTRARLIVTGSSRLDVYRRGGDSLMGRYFRFRMHPITVAEAVSQQPPAPQVIRPPSRLAHDDLTALIEHGGSPEPFVKRDVRFTRRWQQLRKELLLRGMSVT